MQELHVKFCAKCGTRLLADAVLCWKCRLKQAPGEPQVIKSVDKLHGTSVYYKDEGGVTFEAVRKCPVCKRITPWGKVNNHWQRPALLVAGLLTGGLAWLALVLPVHTTVCRICGYKYD